MHRMKNNKQYVWMNAFKIYLVISYYNVLNIFHFDEIKMSLLTSYIRMLSVESKLKDISHENKEEVRAIMKTKNQR